MDQIAKQTFAEEGNFRIADHHQTGQNFGQLAIDQDPHDEGEIGSEEVGLGNTIQGPLARNRRNEHRAIVPINIVLRDPALFFEIIRCGYADHVEQYRQHLLRDLWLFFSVRVEDVDIGVQSAEISTEDENASPGSQNIEQCDIANVPRGLELFLLVLCDGLGLDEKRIDDDLEIQNGFLLPEVVDVQIIETREDRGLQQGVVERFHATVKKDLNTIAEDHALGNVDDESED